MEVMTNLDENLPQPQKLKRSSEESCEAELPENNSFTLSSLDKASNLQLFNNQLSRIESKLDKSIAECLVLEKRKHDEYLNALRTITRRRFKNVVKDFFSVKLGILHQYDPRNIHIPKNYYKKYNSEVKTLISIVTPSFNQANFIEKTIKSVLDQNYPFLEYIVQDGGSTDQTKEILQKHKHRLKHWESMKDSGQSNAINKGFRHSKGQIMAYLNSDDILLPGTLQYIADFFNKNPKVDVVYGHRILINEYDLEIGRWILPKHNNEVLSWADYIPQETLFWRRSIWEKTGGYVNEDFQFAMDWDLILRFRDAGAIFNRLPRFLGAFRVHYSQKTSCNMLSRGVEEMEILRTRCHGRKTYDFEVRRGLFNYKLEHFLLDKLYKLNLLRY